MNKYVKLKIISALMLGCMAVPGFVSAAEQPPEFTLDEVNVTALRYVSKDLDTPADIKVYKEEDLKATGASNVIEALKFSEGIIYHSLGPRGQSWGGMNSKIIMRGVENGTLVLMNGIPINMNGSYNLENIPIEQVEKIEVVKGAGSVLYGSEAFGGVINIITKKKLDNRVSVARSADEQEYDLSVQAGKLSVLYSYGQVDDTGLVSGFYQGSQKSLKDCKLGFGDSEKNNVSWTYRFTDHLSLTHMYSTDDYAVYYKNVYTGALAKNTEYDDEKNLLQLDYKQGPWQYKMFWNQQKLDTNANTSSWDQTKNNVKGLDMQKTWKEGNVTWLVGTMMQKEEYEKLGKKAKGPYSRNHYSTYLQWDKPVFEKTRVILGAREDNVKNKIGKDFDEFCPQFQTVTKINEHSSWYTSIGKSFKMPTFSAMYGSGESVSSNPALKPEVGYNYEIGYKVQEGTKKWKVSLFKTTVNDQISWKKDEFNNFVAQNADYRNAGIEVSCDNQINNKLSFSLGGSYGNPEIQDFDTGNWMRKYGRIQLTSSIHYKNGATAASLSASYLGDRVHRVDYGEDQKKLPNPMLKSSKPMIPVTLKITHNVDENRTLHLTVDNVLNRQDIINHVGTESYMPERSYKFGMTVKF